MLRTHPEVDMDPDTLRVLHAPGYAPAYDATDVDAAEATGADSIGYSEVYKVADQLGVGNHVPVVGHSTTDTRRVLSPQGDAGDNPVAVREDHTITRRVARRITHPGTPLKFAPERYLYAATYRHPFGKVCHVNLHPSPVFTGRLAWARVIRAGLTEVRRARRLGHHVILTGDLNSKSRALHLLLRAAGLRVWRDGIDYVCHSKTLRRVGRETIDRPRFDHPWMLATFVKADR